MALELKTIRRWWNPASYALWAITASLPTASFVAPHLRLVPPLLTASPHPTAMDLLPAETVSEPPLPTTARVSLAMAMAYQPVRLSTVPALLPALMQAI